MRGCCKIEPQTGLIHRQVQTIHGLFVSSWNQMAVEIDGHLNRGMAHLIFHVDRTFAVLMGVVPSHVNQALLPINIAPLQRQQFPHP